MTEPRNLAYHRQMLRAMKAEARTTARISQRGTIHAG
jgi:hypothetical protein